MITAAAEQRALFVFMDTMLPAIPRYRPFQKGIYTTPPSLLPLGIDFGNGILDLAPMDLAPECGEDDAPQHGNGDDNESSSVGNEDDTEVEVGVIQLHAPCYR